MILDRIAVPRRCGLLLQTEDRYLSVDRSVCLSVTVVGPAKTGGSEEACTTWGHIGAG